MKALIQGLLVVGLGFGVFVVSGAAAAESETVKGAKKDFAEFKDSMASRLADMEKQIVEVKDKAKAKGGEAHQKTVQELEASRDKLKAELAELKDDSSEGWKSLKAKLSTAADSLNSKIQKALKN